MGGATSMPMNLLLSKAGEYVPHDKLDIVSEAFRFAESAHDGQVRESGEPFIEHPLETALFLADMRLDSATLAAALLHDVMEDCEVPYQALESQFGAEVARLVDGVTKLTKTEAISEERGTSLRLGSDADLAHAASLRKMIMAMAEDIRVVLIKLADRLHNMRTLDALPPHRRRVFAQETLDIYAPLAHRLGIWEIKWRLEDLAFQHLNTEAYQEISSLLASKRREREEYVERVRAELQQELDRAGVAAEVGGRPKHIYSIHRKIEKYEHQNRAFAEIHDLFALRVMVNEVKDCYAALGVAHARWRPLPAQFDDYIANPKDNLYQSLHTVVLADGASPVEIQIRTHEMHQVAEFGVAAHWLYKEGRPSDKQFEEKMTWLRQLIEWQRDVSDAEAFVESFKTDIFKSQVFVFTPKGEIRELPAGSTPVDFAYRIHTDVGNRCIGAKVKGKLVSLTHQLENGDVVQILTTKADRGPSLDWLNANLGYIRTASARSKVRQWFRQRERHANIQAGHEIFNRQLGRLGTGLDGAAIAGILKLDSAEDLFAALGNGTISVEQVVNKLSTDETEPRRVLDREPVPAEGFPTAVEVLGVGDLLTRMARCCGPIGGDAIIGYITRSRGVTVHRTTCPNILAEQETERLVEVDWGKSRTVYPVKIRVEAWDRVGLLRDVTTRVSEEGVNIATCDTRAEDGVSTVDLTVHVTGIEQLSRVFSKLEGVKGALKVARTA